MDADGTRAGFDLKMIAAVRAVGGVPGVASGGAGGAADFAPPGRARAGAGAPARVVHVGHMRDGEVQGGLAAAAHIYALGLFFALSAQEQYEDEDEDEDEDEFEFNGDGPGGAGRGGGFADLPAQRRGPGDADWPRLDPAAAATAAGVERPS